MVSAHPASAAPEPAPDRGSRSGTFATRRSQLALLLAWPPVLGIGLLATVDAFGLGGVFAATAWTSGLLLIGLTLVLGLRDLRAAESRTTVALRRAETAESRQRARADELAAVLQASERLALGEGNLDFSAILAALTPPGATSFLTRVEGDPESPTAESVVVAAHGPLAPWLVGARRRIEPGRTDDGNRPEPLTSYSVSGRVAGVISVPKELAQAGADVRSTLGVRLADHVGRSPGWLYLLDQAGERVLEPEFVSLAQLVARQIGVAIENQVLLTRVQRQLKEVRQVQQQLVHASKLGAIGELAAAVAHEVNNPLTGILGFSELLLAELPSDDPRHEEAAVIRAEAVRARSIIRALLEFARSRPPQRIPSDLNALSRSTLDLVRFRAQESDVSILEEYAELPILEIDPDALKQVVLNLINNAFDAMPRGGELRVSTHAEGDLVSLTVADSGTGMDTDTRARIFTPFFSTRAAHDGGTGLGLSVSLRIVEGHGGSIEVETEPGSGAAFTVWLPTTWSAFDGAVIVAGDSDRHGDSRDPRRDPRRDPDSDSDADGSTEAGARSSGEAA